MTDELPELPAAPRLSLPAPPDGLRRAVTTGRRRRRRAEWFGGGAVASVVALALALGGLNSAPSAARLDFADDPAVSASPEPAPTGSAPEPAPDESPAPDGSPAAEPVEGSSDPEPNDAPTERPRPAEPAPPLDRDGPYATEQPAYRLAPDECRKSRPTGPPDDAGTVSYSTGDMGTNLFCLRVVPDQYVVKHGSPVRLTTMYCNHGVAERTLRFRGQQHEVLVESGRSSSAWSRRYRFRDRAHEVTVAGGYCAEWATVWEGDLAPGDYSVTGYLLADELRTPEDEHPYLTAEVGIRVTG